ncbi:MAG: PDGLE domain-containing protein [Anaerolinea sp.]|nr:PDGLE domain-containing protein [Anaerolinea sp.]
MFSPILAMHIPDGFVSLPVGAFGWLLLVLLLAVALRQTRQQLDERQIPLIGVLAAFIFAAQMINFLVAGGTSGHLLGGALIAILLGPWASLLVMTSVLAVQALVFQDGGLVALGFNAINMGVIAPFVAYAVYRLSQRVLGSSRSAQIGGAAFAAWVSVILAAAAASVELAASNTAALSIALPAMVSVHMLIGIGEALITVAALSFIRQVRPDLILGSGAKSAAGSGWIAAGLVLALAITLISPLADPNPDGLERVAEDQGFIEAAQEPAFNLLPDYTVPLIENEAASTIAAGIIGTLIVAGVGFVVARTARRSDGQRGGTA